MFRLILLVLILLTPFAGETQQRELAVAIRDTLAAPGMKGRGYVGKGDSIAAHFISGFFKNNGLKPVNGSYYQRFSIPVNTFPDTLKLAIDGKSLKPGTDFVITPDSPSLKGVFELSRLEGDTVVPDFVPLLTPVDTAKLFFVYASPERKKNYRGVSPAGWIRLAGPPLIWYVNGASKQDSVPEIILNKEALPLTARRIELNIRATWFPAYSTANVLGYIPGKNEDRYVVVTAHYDHLGMMGPVIYPGANDNASGVAMMCDLARHFASARRKPEYSMLFVAFAAEETGLLGSGYMAANPPVPLENIRFLINLDMVGSGSEGVLVVNARQFPGEFELMQKINRRRVRLKQVKPRGEAANSDHYPFYAKGVPSFFIYSFGPESPRYHVPDDLPPNAPFTEYDRIFRLVERFIRKL